MTYLTISGTTTLSDNTDTARATSLLKQAFTLNPAVSVQAGMGWEDSVPSGSRSVVVSTQRTLAYDGTTQFQILLPRAAEATTWRLKWTGTGTAPAFRTKRTINLDATSDVSIVILSDTIARISTVAGTALSSAAVAIGDQLLFERTTDAFTSEFADASTGTAFPVVGKGTGYVDVSHGGVLTAEHQVLGSSYADQVRIFSAGPVRVGDIIDIVDTFSYGNVKKVTATMVRDDYIEFTAADMTPETLIGCTNGTSLKIYDRLIKAFSVKAADEVNLYIDNVGFKISPADASGAYAVMTLACTKLEVENTTSAAVFVSALYATMTGSC